MSKKLFLFISCVFLSPVVFMLWQILKKARDLMEANQFEQAMEELIPRCPLGEC
ncbi:MAG: hypothetical protein Ct9H90mP9_1030 [Pseudomonadota bacterium]|nr:MAG: hypothetical protein Ct9H90mP9_1030 [Pseudomonadota bacterium]